MPGVIITVAGHEGMSHAPTFHVVNHLKDEITVTLEATGPTTGTTRR